MMNKNLNFVEKFVRGLVVEADILQHIADWHETDYEICLPDYLGLTEEEHFAFVESDENLVKILSEKRAKFLRSQFRLLIGGKIEHKAQSA